MEKADMDPIIWGVEEAVLFDYLQNKVKAKTLFGI